MASLFVIGECMLELKPTSNSNLLKNYAGDTYNSAIYAKRISPEIDVSYFSGVGEDNFSQEMIEQCKLEAIDTQFVFASKTAQIGIYAISIDETGERSFSYWRKGSAATQMMTLLDESVTNYDELPKLDIAYFSGISLAILSDEERHKLIKLLTHLKANGTRIAYDPNYRPRMWKDKAEAIYWLEESYKISDLVFPGLEDHEDMLGHTTPEEITEYLQQFSTSEQVIKCGSQGVYGYQNHQQVFHLPFTPAPVQVDSTAAGDSFAGGYLAGRLSNKSIADSIVQAATVASFVVQHPGAIVEKTKFSDFLTKI
ncbi:sugar kinase [Algibacillus agarilyticus]|uniref:sugar kinase n=1 Tax=Algibacillus agarilyticus TaxID=2234133 RepID=UPI000DD0C9BF|nr:sugar kinase [Algibacillus agarilyticus]